MSTFEISHSREYPSMAGSDNNTSLFVATIKDWLVNDWVGNCGRKYNELPQEEALVLWDKNTEA